VPDRLRFASARVARLATVDGDGAPHVVPLVFAVSGTTIHSAVDAKPKRTTALKRLANIDRDPRVTLLADHYDDDWTALWWVRADARARVLEHRDPEAQRGLALLAGRYAQYRDQPPEGPVLVIEVQRWTGWAGS